ncbi:DUF6339 family protein [Isoptericola haloaureus]|uniref:DUF6339 family protein n=1 Tax=Isoptericola haloaureus TaxID=1542902 RepID=A0ABU7ZA92_9MICO
MNYLYPRLLTSRARRLFAELQSESASDTLARRSSTSDEGAVYLATGGARVPSEHLVAVQAAVRQIAVTHGFPDDPSAAQKTAFDAAVAAYLHSAAGLSPAEAGSREVWAFFALVLLPDIAAWRFDVAQEDRFVATDITRHVFGRLWWRAELLLDSNSVQPYAAISVLGEADFDQIFARREVLGQNPATVRQLVLVLAELREDAAESGVPSRTFIRETLKELIKLSPFLSLQSLDEVELGAEIRETARAAIEVARTRPDAGDGAR